MTRQLSESRKMQPMASLTPRGGGQQPQTFEGLRVGVPSEKAKFVYL
jgi:hypothetical protein